MKNEDIYKALNDVDDTLLESYHERMKRRKRNRIIKITSTAACLTLVVSGAVAFGFSMNNQTPTVKENNQTSEISISSKPEESTNGTSGETAVEIPWDKLSNAERYGELLWNGGKYSSCVKKIDREKISEDLGQNVTLVGYTYHFADGRNCVITTEHKIQAKLYSIEGISTACALAVQFEGDTDYYAYVSWTYQPQNLGQFIEDLSLDENLYFNNMYFQKETKEWKVEFSDDEQKTVAEHLFADLSAVAIEDFDSHNFGLMMVEFGISIPVLGYENIYIGVTEDGYITTNILDTGKAFYIGTENVQSIVNYAYSQTDNPNAVCTENSAIQPDESQTDGETSSAYNPE